jgi:hypothetical protein
MSIFTCFVNLLPQFHAYMDDDQRYNVGATWKDSEGLTDRHNLELKYVRNSERLALQGKPQPDGSWSYVDTNGTIHTITADRARVFMEKTHEHANIMCNMLDRLKEAGLLEPIVDTSAQLV